MTVWYTVLVSGAFGVELVCGGGNDELLGDDVGRALEVVGGAGGVLVDGVEVGGGGGGELVVGVVVGGAGVDDELGMVVEVVGGPGAVGVDVFTPPSAELVVFDMAKVWRFSRGRFLYGIDMSIWRCATWHDRMRQNVKEGSKGGEGHPMHP